MNKNILLGLTSLGTLVALGLVISSVSLAAEDTTARKFGRGNFDPAQMEELRAEMEAKHQVVEAALESGDYSAWLAAIPENSPMAENITEANFPRLVEAHRLMAEARSIMEELGLPGGPQMGMKMGPGFHGGPHGLSFGADKSAGE